MPFLLTLGTLTVPSFAAKRACIANFRNAVKKLSHPDYGFRVQKLSHPDYGGYEKKKCY